LKLFKAPDYLQVHESPFLFGRFSCLFHHGDFGDLMTANVCFMGF